MKPLVNEFEFQGKKTFRDRGCNELIPLPEWSSSDGYQLMESFAACLRNPVYRERLRVILNSRRGVFRKFKDVLKERSDLEQRWYAYKHKEMVKVVRQWYNLLCDSWGAEALGGEPEEIENLFLDEFTIRVIPGDSRLVEENRLAWESEVYSGMEAPLKALCLECIPCLGDEVGAGRSFERIALEALSPGGEGCGVLCFFLLSRGAAQYAWGDFLYIKPEFRGAGLAAGLLDQGLKLCYEKGARGAVFSLPPEGEVLKENLIRRGGRAFGPFLLLDL